MDTLLALAALTSLCLNGEPLPTTAVLPRMFGSLNALRSLTLSLQQCGLEVQFPDLSAASRLAAPRCAVVPRRCAAPPRAALSRRAAARRRAVVPRRRAALLRLAAAPRRSKT